MTLCGSKEWERLPPSGFLAGVRAVAPIALGYVPIGFAYGVLAKAAGLTLAEIALMSLIVYAGSSQFIGSKMLAAGDPYGAILSTTFLVNLRHMLMSAALVPSFRHLPAWQNSLLAYELTDESFAVISASLQGGPADARWVAGLQVSAQLCWLAASVAGALAGSLVPDNRLLGLDFALPAMFIGLLLLQMGNGGEQGKKVVVAVAAAALSIAVAILVPGKWNVILAAVLASTLGVLLR
jgi:4-azaleucine resistance transporter AzlC